MWYNNYINPEFASYLNRHCNGIMALKDEIRKIKVSFELADAFSTKACRFYIEIEFLDWGNPSVEFRRSANKFFYDALNESGSKFVSFIYKPQKESNIDIDEVKSFISHYQFAQSLFEGFIRTVIPDGCIIEVTPLETEPFFNYLDNFLMMAKYSEKEERPFFEKKYSKIFKRRFDFDCHYHNSLAKAAVIELENDSNILTDEELHDAGCGRIEEIRRFIVEKEVPFSIGYQEAVISCIKIDASMLKEKMTNYIPDTHSSIKPVLILNIIKAKKHDTKQKELMVKQKSDALSIKLGDYICVDSLHSNAVIGIIKEIELDYYDDLVIKYNTLKKDLLESRIAVKSAKKGKSFTHCSRKYLSMREPKGY